MVEIPSFLPGPFLLLKPLYPGIDHPGQLLRALRVEMIEVAEMLALEIIVPLVVDVHPPEIRISLL